MKDNSRKSDHKLYTKVWMKITTFTPFAITLTCQLSRGIAMITKCSIFSSFLLSNSLANLEYDFTEFSLQNQSKEVGLIGNGKSFPATLYGLILVFRDILSNQKLESLTLLQCLPPASRIISHKSSFIVRTCNLWNILPSSCFPESYNLPSFKSKINKLDLISLSSLFFAFFLLPLLGLFIGHYGLSPT